MSRLGIVLQGISVSILMSCSSLVFADISGLVFRDFNASGTFDTGSNFNEVAQAGVTIKAFDATGAQKASATSAADGSYTLTGLTSGADYRVEFSWSETWLKSGKSGGTSVQFAKDGATNLNFALSSPEDFSQDNPQLVTTNFAVGESSDPKVAGQSRLIEFGYLSGANGRRFAASDDEAITLQPEITDIAISSAPSSAGTANAVSPNVTGHSRTDTVKMGEVGPLYGLAYHRDTNILLAGAFMKRFVGFPNGASDTKLGTIYAIDRKVSPNTVTPFFTANAGVDSHDYSNAALNAPGGDTTAASQVGKAGWADIDLSPDGGMLYAVNLFDKKIYAIPVTKGVSGLSAGAASTITFPASATTDVCANGDWAAGGLKVTQDSVLATVTCTAETSQSASDLHFYVYKISRDNPSTFTKIVDRGNYPRDIDWHPWVSDPYNYDHGGYNQPWAMDVEFDDLGRLYVGVRNRSADMESANDGNFFFEFGDTIVGLPNGDGTYDTTYTDEFVDDNSGHMENDMGALAHWSGSGTIVTPAHIGNLIQGIRTYSTTTPITSTANGTVSPLRYFGIHQTPRDVAALGDPFGKVAGLGDLEVLTQPAPIEVGNRVWLDTDKDGIQDAGEAGIANVQVQLTCATDNATVTTGSDGSYYFSNASAGNATFMSAGESCTLSIATGQTALNGYSITTQNADSVTDNNATTDIRDSDADGNSSISFTVGNAGDSNHGLDFGYQVASVVTNSTVDQAGCAAWLSNATLDDGSAAVGKDFVWAVNNSTGVVLMDMGAAKVQTGTPSFPVGVRTVNLSTVIDQPSLLSGMGSFDVAADGTTYMAAAPDMGILTGGNHVIKISPAGVVTTIATINTVNAGFGDVYAANGYVYVSNLGDGKIYKIDPALSDPNTSFTAVYDHGLDGRTAAGLSPIVDADKGNGWNFVGTFRWTAGDCLVC